MDDDDDDDDDDDGLYCCCFGIYPVEPIADAGAFVLAAFDNG